MSILFRLTSKSTAVICPSSDVAPIMIVAIMKSHTKRVTITVNKYESDGLIGIIKRPPIAEPSPHHSSQSWRLQAASPLPASSLSTTPELHPRSPRWARPWYDMVVTGTRPGHARGPAGHARGSRPRKRMQALGQAQRPGRRRPRSRATCALTAADGARRRHAPMSREARVRQPEPGGSASQHVTFAPYLPK